LDFVLYWGSLNEKAATKIGLLISLEAILLSLKSLGHYDYFLQSGVSNLLMNSIDSGIKDGSLSENVQQLCENHKAKYSSTFDEPKALDCLHSDLQKFYVRSFSVACCCRLNIGKSDEIS